MCVCFVPCARARERESRQRAVRQGVSVSWLELEIDPASRRPQQRHGGNAEGIKGSRGTSADADERWQMIGAELGGGRLHDNRDRESQSHATYIYNI